MAGEAAHELDEQSWLYRPCFPDEWERMSLLSMARWVNGLAFSDFQFSNTGKPVIKIAEIKGGITGQTKFTNQTFEESVFVTKGDMLFSWSGQPETSINVFWWRGRDGWLNQHIFKVTPIEDLDPVFFFYVLRYLKPNFIGIARNKQTTGLGHVTRRDIENIEAAFPPLADQRAIAHILGTLDDKIELNRKMNETLEAMARALFKSWFIDFDPVRAKKEGRWKRGQSLPGLPAHLYDLFPAEFEDSELGEIPKGWEVKTIGDLADVGGGSTPSTADPRYWDNGTHYWVTPKDLSGLSVPVLLNTERLITDAGLEQISSGLLPVGTVLMSSRAPIGYIAITEIPVAINQGFIAMKPREGVPSLFLLLWTHFAQEEIVSQANGSTFLEISKSSFRPIPAVRPIKSILNAFDNVATSWYRRIVSNERTSRTLATLRDTLLPKLLSGKLRAQSTN